MTWLLIFGGVWAGIGSLHLRRIVSHARERTRARNKIRAITAIADVRAEGTLARVTGVVRSLGPVLTSPLTGRACIAYRARVDGRRGMLEVPITKQEITPFAIDGVQIHATKADFGVPASPLVPSVEQRDRYDAFLEPYGLGRHDPRFQGGAVFDEVVVTEGMRVTVIGIVMLEVDRPEASGGYRDREHRWRLVGDGEHPIVIGEAVD